MQTGWSLMNCPGLQVTRAIGVNHWLALRLRDELGDVCAVDRLDERIVERVVHATDRGACSIRPSCDILTALSGESKWEDAPPPVQAGGWILGGKVHSTRVNRHHLTAVVGAICVAIVLAPIAAEAGGPTAHKVTKVKGTVNVGNFPATQNVTGTVNVNNLPAVQNVAGSVTVGNLPSTQHISGTVTADPGIPGTPYADWSQSLSLSTSLSVPSGQNLVIQSVSVRVALTSGDQCNVYLL
jgi:hypothetical protein